MTPYVSLQDTVLSNIHGAKAFKDFIDKKNTRVPEFLEMVSEQHTEQVNKTTDVDGKQETKKSRATSAQSQFGTPNYVF